MNTVSPNQVRYSGFDEKEFALAESMLVEIYNSKVPLVTYKILDIVKTVVDPLYHDATVSDRAFRDAQVRMRFVFAQEVLGLTLFVVDPTQDVVFYACKALMSEAGIDRPKSGDHIIYMGKEFKVSTVKNREASQVASTGRFLEYEFIATRFSPDLKANG